MDTNEKELKKIIERLERLEHAIFDPEMKPMAQTSYVVARRWRDYSSDQMILMR